MLITIKSIFDEVRNNVWLMTKSKNKAPLLIVAQKNLVYMILQIMDYADRNPTKLKSKVMTSGSVENITENQDMGQEEEGELVQVEDSSGQYTFEKREQDLGDESFAPESNRSNKGKEIKQK